MSSPEDVSERPEDARRQSKAVWDTMAPGWHERREELWHRSRLVGEWMIRKLDPQPGDTVLELAAALADTGFMAAPLIGETGRVSSNYNFIAGSDRKNDDFSSKGAASGDVFCGFGGVDSYIGTLNGDIFIGGDGNDHVDTNNGTFYGGDGNDYVWNSEAGGLVVNVP